MLDLIEFEILDYPDYVKFENELIVIGLKRKEKNGPITFRECSCEPFWRGQDDVIAGIIRDILLETTDGIEPKRKYSFGNPYNSYEDRYEGDIFNVRVKLSEEDRGGYSLTTDISRADRSAEMYSNIKFNSNGSRYRYSINVLDITGDRDTFYAADPLKRRCIDETIFRHYKEFIKNTAYELLKIKPENAK